MSAPEFFIADDGLNDPWIWRENCSRPIQVLNLLHIAPEHAPLLDLIRAAVEGEVREEWGVRWSEGFTTAPYGERDARATTERRGEGHLLLRRTVITGAWEEER